MIDFSIIKDTYPYLLRGTLVTLQIAALSSMIGFILGTLLGFLQCSTHKLLASLVTFYVTIFRGTPMLIQISFAGLLLPEIGIPLFWAAILAIGFNSAAYISQIIKSGIQSVDKGQREAAHVLGLNNFQIMRLVIFPQAIRVVIPALLNEFITLIKDSSLASIIGVVELFKESTRIISYSFNPIPIYCAMAAIYLILTTTLSIATGYLERKMNYHVNR